MQRKTLTLGLISLILMACSSEPANNQPPPVVDETAPGTESDVEVTELPALAIGEYEVSVNYEGPLRDGHFNFHVTGPEFAAIRQWVGPEDAQGVLVSKAEVLADHIHAGVEMPNPIPQDPHLWIEIETPEGKRLKGSLRLVP